MTSFHDIRIERKGDVGLLLLNRTDANNAVYPAMLKEICDALDILNSDDGVRAILLAAEGKHFSVGADFTFLNELKSTPAVDIHDRIYAHFQGAVRRLFRSAKPTVAAIDGAAITVGCELALACDFRLVTEKAFFQESWIKLGILPPLGGMFLLPRIVGLALANDMILRGRGIRGEEAVRIGLAAELASSETLRERAIAFTEELAVLPPRAYAFAKEGIQRGLESTIDREWSAAVSAQAILLGSEDFKEGLEAVKEKRQGRFTGR